MMKLLGEDGNVYEYEIIMTFKIENNNQFYIVYTDNTYNEENKLKIYAAKYFLFDNTKLEPITTKEEWNIIEHQLRLLKIKGNLK